MAHTYGHTEDHYLVNSISTRSASLVHGTQRHVHLLEDAAQIIVVQMIVGFDSCHLPSMLVPLTMLSSFKTTLPGLHSLHLRALTLPTAALGNNLFRPDECVYVPAQGAAFCRPELTFRRFLLNNHGPAGLQYA